MKLLQMSHFNLSCSREIWWSLTCYFCQKLAILGYYMTRAPASMVLTHHWCCTQSCSGTDSQSTMLLQRSPCWSFSWIDSSMQSVLCAAARFVFQHSSRASVSAEIRDTLHRLSFPQRITYKLCLSVSMALLLLLCHNCVDLCLLSQAALNYV